MKFGRAYVELSLAMGLAGSSVAVGKLVATQFPVFLAGMLRFALALVILLPLLWFKERGGPRLSLKIWGILTLQAFTGVFGFTVCLLYGLQYTSAAEAGIITSTTPAVLGILARVWLKERLTLNQWVGIALTVAGVLSMNVLGANFSAARGTLPLLGNLLIFGAVVGEALFTIYRKLLPVSLSPLATTTYVSALGFVMFLPLALNDLRSYDVAAMTLGDGVLLLYYGVVVTVVAFLLWFQGVSKVPASTAAVFTGVMPISAILLSYALLGERFAWTHLIGLTCVLAGIACIAKQSKQRENHPAILPGYERA